MRLLGPVVLNSKHKSQWPRVAQGWGLGSCLLARPWLLPPPQATLPTGLPLVTPTFYFPSPCPSEPLHWPNFPGWVGTGACSNLACPGLVQTRGVRHAWSLDWTLNLGIFIPYFWQVIPGVCAMILHMTYHRHWTVGSTDRMAPRDLLTLYQRQLWRLGMVFQCLFRHNTASERHAIKYKQCNWCFSLLDFLAASFREYHTLTSW